MPTATLFPNMDFALSTAWSKACELRSVEVRSSVFPPLSHADVPQPQQYILDVAAAVASA